jgi:AMIN domain
VTPHEFCFGIAFGTRTEVSNCDLLTLLESKSMQRFSKRAPVSRALVCAWFAGSLCLIASNAAAQVSRIPVATVRTVSIRSGVNGVGKDAGDDLELQITANQAVTPQAQIVISPYRLVIDFPNSLPGAALHNLAVNRGDVKGIRVGLFARNPPVTRVVLDLKAPIVYQVSSSGQNVVFKLSSATRATAMPDNTPAAAVVPPKPEPHVEVDFKRGLMTIHADKATLAEVLVEVRRKTGADIQIPPGADQEQVFTDLGPAPARDVMGALLNGSRFNFVVVGADNDPNALRSVILSARTGVSMPAVSSPQMDATAQQPFSNAVQPDPSRQDMRRPPEGVEPQMPAEQEDPGDTPPPTPPSL